jgi:hypothetical protein
MADRKISDLTALTTPASGDYVPIVDISESAAASKNKRITIEELMRGAPDGTAAAPSIAFESDPNSGLFSPGADQVAISTNGTGRLFVNSTGLVGLGTSSPTKNLEVSTSSGAAISIRSSTAGSIASPKEMRLSFTGVSGDGATPLEKAFIYAVDQQLDTGATFMTLGTAGTRAVTIDSSQRVGIGTTATSGAQLTVKAISDTATGGIVLRGFSDGSANGDRTIFIDALSESANYRANVNYSAWQHIFTANGTERARIDSSGRLLVGTSSARSVATQSWGIQQEGTTFANTGVSTVRNSADAFGSYFVFGKSRGTAVGANTIVANGDELGRILFSGADGTDVDSFASWISCEVDGTPGADDMPGRLVFSTTADGAASPTERMRIGNVGDSSMFGTLSVLRLHTETTAGTAQVLLQGRYGATSGTPASGTSSILVYTNGNVENTNNSYGAISDIKLKENIVDAGSQWSDLKALQVRKYNFKEGQTHTQIGLVAQEVELVSPGLVSESPDRDEDGNDLGTVTKSVNYSVLYMKAVKALQEAMERIETLEAKVAALEAS